MYVSASDIVALLGTFVHNGTSPVFTFSECDIQDSSVSGNQHGFVVGEWGNLSFSV